MADKSGAYTFSVVFRELAESKTDPDWDADAAARRIWDRIEGGDYDFDTYQMEADDDLVALGLATTPCPDCGTGIKYGNGKSMCDCDRD